ncbi:MAG: hypothetical protein HZB45_21455 [Mycolicibacterium rufum]|uniref:Uncharacterized protein n=1 Tax=Mycolicibacterium chlorophenolicum TaxID=37916 RepID=A0A0J6VJK3_9MYCO|nr:hypothetical protein [Mycolicibacterium chlorophenolicum]KMO71175.1 hypothetical protein MCHLDSM_04704 [Mycolicibacterium chlorophenolicum]MBI5340254.1 hypothetical protein [Mycolicibacterium rufum]
MESTVSALAVLAVLTAWHLRNRRHPGWLASPDGRFYIFCGYALVAIAAYWLQEAPTATAWEWAFGNLWALAGMVALVLGFGHLNRVTAEHALASQAVETLAPSDASAN